VKPFQKMRSEQNERPGYGCNPIETKAKSPSHADSSKTNSFPALVRSDSPCSGVILVMSPGPHAASRDPVPKF
jgi:hypothetical protein